jgi:hypothetical protein
MRTPVYPYSMVRIKVRKDLSLDSTKSNVASSK